MKEERGRRKGKNRRKQEMKGEREGRRREGDWWHSSSGRVFD
jgi:hypothetical protein